MLVYLVIRDILRPGGDLVRMAGDDDPSGGVLEDAADRFTVPSLQALVARRRGKKAGAAPPGQGWDAPATAGVE